MIDVIPGLAWIEIGASTQEARLGDPYPPNYSITSYMSGDEVNGTHKRLAKNKLAHVTPLSEEKETSVIGSSIR